MATTPNPLFHPQSFAAQEAVLNGLLRLGVEPIPLEALLSRALDEILAIPWLPLNPTAAIFLTGEEPEVLVLAVERNLSPALCRACGRVPFGHCLCGRAAATRTTQFAACLDARHETTYPGILPHGHYNLPLVHGKRLLGVLTLYLPHGHTPAEGEAAFLEAVANAVAKLIAHVRVEDELVVAMERAGEANRQKSAFLAVLGHEIRTPLNGVLGMVDLLLHTDLTEEQEEYAQTAHTSATTLSMLLNDCLELSKAEAGKLELVQRELDPLAVLASAIEVVAPRAMEKGVELVAVADGDLPATVVGDAAHLRQLLVHLAGNAVKFTDAGDEVVVEVGCKRTEEHTMLYVAVRDTGIGMEPELVPRLFEPFVQADASATRTHGGSGLGLAISSQLVEHMGGEIQVESAPGEGTTVRFTVRIADPSPPHPLPAELSTAQILLTPSRSTTITAVADQLRRWGGTMVWTASIDRLKVVVEQGRKIGRPTDLLIVDRDHAPHRASLYRWLAELPAPNRPAVLEVGWADASATPVRPAAPLTLHRLPQPLHPTALRHALARLLDGPAVPAPRKQNEEGIVAAPRARILIAEDNPVNQLVLVHLVHQFGHEPVVVANGAEAVAAVAEGGFDLVLMDHQMPVMAGDEATARIRASEQPGRRIPIIAVTATALESTREACLRAGMDGYLVKPVAREVLADTLQQWLAATRPAVGSNIR